MPTGGDPVQPRFGLPCQTFSYFSWTPTRPRQTSRYSLKKAQNVLGTHPSQADPAGNFIGDVLPVDVSYPGAGDVLHATTAHPDLQAGIIQQRQRV